MVKSNEQFSETQFLVNEAPPHLVLPRGVRDEKKIMFHNIAHYFSMNNSISQILLFFQVLMPDFFTTFSYYMILWLKCADFQHFSHVQPSVEI